MKDGTSDNNPSCSERASMEASIIGSVGSRREGKWSKHSQNSQHTPIPTSTHDRELYRLLQATAERHAILQQPLLSFGRQVRRVHLRHQVLHDEVLDALREAVLVTARKGGALTAKAVGTQGKNIAQP